jgi:hypothetical protein
MPKQLGKRQRPTSFR